MKGLKRKISSLETRVCKELMKNKKLKDDAASMRLLVEYRKGPRGHVRPVKGYMLAKKKNPGTRQCRMHGVGGSGRGTPGISEIEKHCLEVRASVQSLQGDAVVEQLQGDRRLHIVGISSMSIRCDQSRSG